MATRLAGYQPQYFPRLHYIARILNADIFKCSDTLQYVRRHAYPPVHGKVENGPSFQAHTPVKTARGLHLLDIPTQHVGKKEDRMLHTVGIEYGVPWHEKHLRTIEISYAKASQFKKLFPSLVVLLSRRYGSLAECTVATTLWSLAIILEVPFAASGELSAAAIMGALQQSNFRLRKIVRMSELGMAPAKKGTGQDVNQWIIDTCRALGADEYYMGGTASAAYIDHEQLKAAGITLVTQDWRCEEYSQQFPKTEFIPNLSILDLVMNVEPRDARRILRTTTQ